MKVHGIAQLVKKDVPLYYRNDYEALGDVEFSPDNRHQIPLEFSVEIKPTGDRVISVRIKNRIDYPLIPLVRALKQEISLLEKNGQLK